MADQCPVNRQSTAPKGKSMDGQFGVNCNEFRVSSFNYISENAIESGGAHE
jgi:hypothetical protein